MQVISRNTINITFSHDYKIVFNNLYKSKRLTTYFTIINYLAKYTVKKSSLKVKGNVEINAIYFLNFSKSGN